MTWREQLQWAVQNEPWNAVKLLQDDVSRSSVTMIGGDVTRMPLLRSRPCFGNPIAWLLHGVLKFRKTANGVHETRCGRCKAREACERVSESRLSSSTELSVAAAAFRSVGGRQAYREARTQEPRRALGQVIQLLVARGPFTNVNDGRAREWVANERLRLRAQATERKREERARKSRNDLKAGAIPPLLDDQLWRERQFRAIRYAQYQKSGVAPKTITVDPNDDNARFTSEVWETRIRLSLQRRSIAAYTVAGEMIARGWSHNLNRESLRSRVGPALKRISHLERSAFPGSDEPVWPPFDAEALLNELLAETPYEPEVG